MLQPVAVNDRVHQLCAVLPLHQIAAAAVSRTAAEIASAACVPAMKALACPISEPNSATPSTLPVCRVELSTPASMPERDLSTLPSKVEVKGGTKRPSPPPSTTSCRPIAQ